MRNEVLEREFNKLKELELKLYAAHKAASDSGFRKGGPAWSKASQVASKQLELVKELIKNDSFESDNTADGSIAKWIKFDRWTEMKEWWKNN